MTTDRPDTENGGNRAQPTVRQAGASGLRLTAFGALLVVLVPTVLGGLLDGVFTAGYGALTAAGFVVGCLVAAARTRPRDLLALAVTPPLLFVTGVALAETVRSWGSGDWFRNHVVAVTTALAGDAFWVVSATAATALVALARSHAARRVPAGNSRPSRQSPLRWTTPRRAR